MKVNPSKIKIAGVISRDTTIGKNIKDSIEEFIVEAGIIFNVNRKLIENKDEILEEGFIYMSMTDVFGYWFLIFDISSNVRRLQQVDDDIKTYPELYHIAFIDILMNKVLNGLRKIYKDWTIKFNNCMTCRLDGSDYYITDTNESTFVFVLDK